MSEPTGLEKILTWLRITREQIAVGAQHPGIGQEFLRTLTALEEAVSVIDDECLPGEIDAAFERLLAILNGKREEGGDGKA